MKKKKQEEVYNITMKGLMGMCPGIDEYQINHIWDSLELYSYRNGVNAILIRDGGIFVEVELPKK
mgnify:CR=1 FL=1